MRGLRYSRFRLSTSYKLDMYMQIRQCAKRNNMNLSELVRKMVIYCMNVETQDEEKFKNEVLNTNDDSSSDTE